MTNHPNRNTRIAYICPRGFANEIAYWRVKSAEVAEVQKLIDTYADDTSGHAGWIEKPTAKERSMAIAWEDRQYARQVGSTWGY